MGVLLFTFQYIKKAVRHGNQTALVNHSKNGSDVAVAVPFRVIRKCGSVVILERELCGCFFIDDDGAVRMELDRGTGNHGGHRAFDRFRNDVGFACAGDEHQEALGVKNRSDTHCEGACRHFLAFGGIEIGTVLSHCDRGQVDGAGSG